MQRGPADQLYVVVAQTDGALTSLAYSCKRLGEQFVEHILLLLFAPFIVQSLQARSQPVAKFCGFCFQSFTTQGFELWFEGIDLIYQLGIAIDFFFIGVAPKQSHKFF